MPIPRPIRGNRASNPRSAAGPNARGLNPQRQRFVDAMLVPGTTLKDAAIKAGYNPRSARDRGAKLAKMPKIKAAIEEGRAKLAAKLDITAERTLLEIARVAYSDLRDIVDWGAGGVVIKESGALSADAAAAVAEVSEAPGPNGVARRVKLHDKVAALNMLSRHQGLLKDRLEVSGPGGGPIEVADAARARVAGRIARVAANIAAGDDPSGSDAG